MEEQEFDIENTLEEIREASIDLWVKNCYKAFDMLKERGVDTDDFGEREEIREAGRKMLALFEIREEYEKCKELSWILEREFPGFETTPNRDYIDNLGIA